MEPKLESPTLGLLDSLPIGVFLINPEGTVLSWNRCLEHWIGIPAPTIIGTSLYKHFPHLAGPKYSHRIKKIFAGGAPIIFSPELHPHLLPAPKPNGARVFSTIVAAVKSTHGSQYDALFTLQDVSTLAQEISQSRSLRKQALNEITVRKKIEEQLHNQAQELKQFAGVVSHDLRAPLRQIATFAQFILDEQGKSLDEQGRMDLNRIFCAAERMQKLIDDLLKLATVKRDHQKYRRENLNNIVRDLLNDLEQLIQEAGAVITVDPLPEIEAHPTQMRQLFQNLITNSIKYARKDLRPRIHIGAKEITLKNLCRISFKDNGIGFESENAEKIFKPFTRLLTTGVEGSGIGLSTVKKIVLLHGGKISAAGFPGRGATFTVDLPINQKTV